MNNKRSNAKLGYSSPSIPPISYRNGRSRLDRRYPQASGHSLMSPGERSMARKAIMDDLVNEHDEFQQVPSKIRMQRITNGLYSQNNSLAGSNASVDDETREDLSTGRASDVDTTGDDDTFRHLDRYMTRKSPLNCARECTMDDDISFEDVPSMTLTDSIPDDEYMATNRTQSSCSSSRFDDEDAEELNEARRLAEQPEQVNTKKIMSSKRNFLKKVGAVPSSKLVIEHPTKTTEIYAPEDTPKRVTERGETKPSSNSALWQEQNPTNDLRAANRLPSSMLLLLEVANSKATQIYLKNKCKGIKMRLADEKRAEKQAMIAIKKEEQVKRREMKAAVKEMKLLSIKQRAEEKSARVAAEKLMKAQMMKKKKLDEVAAMEEDLRVALVLRNERQARNTKEKEHQSTMAPRQEKTKRFGTTVNKRNKFADFSVLVDMQDESIKNTDVMSRIENFFLCIGTPCALTISGEDSLTSLGEKSCSNYEVSDENSLRWG